MHYKHVATQGVYFCMITPCMKCQESQHPFVEDQSMKNTEQRTGYGIE